MRHPVVNSFAPAYNCTNNQKETISRFFFSTVLRLYKQTKISSWSNFLGKVRTFWEAHIIWKNLPQGFDKSADLLNIHQNHEEYFFKLRVLLKKSELYFTKFSTMKIAKWQHLFVLWLILIWRVFTICYKNLYQLWRDTQLTKLRSKCLFFRNFNFLKLKVKNGATEFFCSSFVINSFLCVVYG